MIYKGATVHRQFHEADEVQVCTLLSVKTGGCPEDCGYCPQAARYHTDVEAQKLLPVDIAICAAAVSDFKPKNKSKQKIKKDKNKFTSLDLEKNKDILEYLGKNNKLRPKILVGFSAETENLIENSIKKLNYKHCDIIIANDVSKKDTGFNVDYNKVSVIEKSGKIENIPKNKKSYIASRIAKKIIDEFLINDKNTN